MEKLDLRQLQVMGILNVTPDSFSDGGQYTGLDTALYRAETMLKEGATIIDIGGESTRPNAKAVSITEELQRVIPIIEALKANFDCYISVDTSKPEVMQAAIDARADMLNDVRALQVEGALGICAKSDISICLMHMQGQPDTMQIQPNYSNIVIEVKAFFSERILCCEQAGITHDRLILDPGFGFGKTLNHNTQLLTQLEQFTKFNLPLLVGISRKTMIGQLLQQSGQDAAVDQRLYGSLSAAVIAVLKGANIIRVHDVKASVDALKIVSAIQA